MNAITSQEAIKVRIVSNRASRMTVSPWGFPMEVLFEYDEGESPIFWPTELAHPGSPPNACLLSCVVGGVDIYEMLDNEQIERVEDAILDQLER